MGQRTMSKRRVGRPKKKAAARPVAMESPILNRTTVEHDQSEEERFVTEDPADRGNSEGNDEAPAQASPMASRSPPPVFAQHKMAAEVDDQSMSSTHPWVDVIKGNRLKTHGLPIEFVAPTIVDGILRFRSMRRM